MNPSLYLAILCLTGTFALILAIECYIYRSVGNAKRLFFLMSSISCWAFLLYLTIVEPDTILKSIYHDFLFIAIIFTPINFFYFVCSFTRYRNKGGIFELIYLLFIIPFSSILILVTNPLHHLFFTAYSLKPFGVHFQYYAHFGIFFWIHTGFAYLLTLASMGLLVYEYNINRRRHKQQILLMILGSVSPIIFNLIYLIDSSVALYDYTPIALLIAGLFFGYTVNRYQIFTKSPISRKLNLHSIQDAVLILDDEQMIIEYNLAFEKQFKLEKDLRFSSAQFLPLTLRRILSLSKSGTSYNQQVRVADENSNLFFYKVKKIAVDEKGSQFYIYLITDANNTKILLKAVEEKQEALQSIRDNKLRFLSSISHELRAPLNTLKSVADLLGEKALWSSTEQLQLASLAKDLHHKTNLILDYARIEAKEMNAVPLHIPLEQIEEVISPHVIMYSNLTEVPKYLVTQSTCLPLIEHAAYAMDLVKKNDFSSVRFDLSPHAFCIEAILERKIASTIFESLTAYDFESPSLTIEKKLHISLIKSLAELSGGHIDINPVSDFESKLVITLPTRLRFEEDSASQPIAVHNLLLIDDSLITYFICQKLCALHHIQLDYAENLIDAQVLLKKEVQYQWILLDLHLENASGFEVIHQLKNKQTMDTLFIAISSDQVTLDSDHVNTHGFDHFIHKPIKSADIHHLTQLTKSK